MKTLLAGVVAVGLFATATALPSPGQAAEPPSPGNPQSVFGVLAGTSVPAGQLGAERAQGIVVSIGNATASAHLKQNSVGDNSVTGYITNTGGSVTNNTGITNVFQNTGNNSLIQNNMAITINLH